MARKLQVFDLDTWEYVRALAGHIGAVYAMTIQDNKLLFSGSYDSTIKVNFTFALFFLVSQMETVLASSGLEFGNF